MIYGHFTGDLHPLLGLPALILAIYLMTKARKR